MIRLFTAIPLPQKIRQMLHVMGRSLQGARAIPEEQIHLTMRFIGEVESSLLHDIKAALDGVRHTSFPLRIQGVGHFPPRGKPRVVWAGASPRNELAALKRKIDHVLLPIGIEADRRKFSPHVSIARINSTSLNRVGDFLAGNSLLAFDEVEADRFALYSSILSHKGAIHTLEADYLLDPP